MLRFILLWLFHLILALKRFVSTLLPRRLPRPLRTRRRKVPEHLAVILRSEGISENATVDLADALESVRRLVSWCKVAGIHILSVFDEAGILLGSWEQVQAALEEPTCIVHSSVSTVTEHAYSNKRKPSAFSSALRFPPTPPLSKTASTSSLQSSSPDLHSYAALQDYATNSKLASFRIYDSGSLEGRQRRDSHSTLHEGTASKPFTLYLISKDLGKPQLARVAREMASSAVSEQARGMDVASKEATISISAIASRLEEASRTDGWPCPDLLLIHTPATSRQAQLSPLEFEGFPPWQMHLTEVTYIPPRLPQTDFLRRFWSIPDQFPTSVSERTFRVALDEYDGAEMRFGK